MTDPSLRPPDGGDAKMDELASEIAHVGIVPGMIVEAGACDGRDAMRLLDHFPGASALCIEGLAENFSRWLSPNSRFRSRLAVLSDRIGPASFNVCAQNGIHSLRDRGLQIIDRRAVSTETLDAVLASEGIERVDLLLVDCEGCSFEVLSGAEAALRSTRSVFVETEDGELFAGEKLHDEVARILESAGFGLRKIRWWEIESGKRQAESLWIRVR